MMKTRAIASEIVRHDLFNRVHIGLDFFDASINRIAAWVIGTRNMKKPCCVRCWNLPLSCASWKRRAITLRVWHCWKSRNRCRGRRSGKCIANVTIRQQGSEWLESVRAYEKEIFESPRVNTAGCGASALSGLRVGNSCRPDKTRQRRIRH
ncbi:L-rhamnose isomerase [Escherichia coli]